MNNYLKQLRPRISNVIEMQAKIARKGMFKVSKEDLKDVFNDLANQLIKNTRENREEILYTTEEFKRVFAKTPILKDVLIYCYTTSRGYDSLAVMYHRKVELLIDEKYEDLIDLNKRIEQLKIGQNFKSPNLDGIL